MKKFLYIFPVMALMFVASNVSAAPEDDFMIVVQTDVLGGASSNTQFTIPTAGTGYGYTVDCDDTGPMEVTGGQGGTYTCNYASAGTYVIRIAGTFPQIYFNDGGDKLKIQGIHQWGTGEWRTMDRAFYGCSDLRITDDQAPVLSNTTDMGGMFWDAVNIGRSTGTWDWDTSTVTNMNNMFRGATDFNEPIESWDVSKVVLFAGMFMGNTAFNQEIGTWTINTSEDVRMDNMFWDATAFNKDVSNWDTSRVINMNHIFTNATSFNQDLGSGDGSDWDTSNVTNMNSMFAWATAFNGDISKWDTSSVTDMADMFWTATSFDHSLGSWDVSEVESMGGMLVDSNISVKNYDDTLVKWNELPTLVNDVYFEVDSNYCSTAAVAARNHMMDTVGNGGYNWTIDDGTLGAGCPPPIISETTQVSTPSTDTTPNYTFNTDKAGTIAYEGSCSSETTNATIGNNTITLNELSPGTYSNCTIQVTDSSSNVSNTLSISTFTIENQPESLYRFWSEKNKSHFYTASEAEKDYIIAHYDDYVWKYERIANDVFKTQVPNSTPVYRFWSDTHKGHFYTASLTEKNYIIANYDIAIWKYEGTAYYTYPTQQSNTKPVFRFWSAKNKHHFYTASEAEKEYVIANYDDYTWKYEGKAWYVAE